MATRTTKKRTSARVADRAKQAVDGTARSARTNQRKAKRAIDNAQQKWERAHDTMNKYVRENPMKAAAIAAGVGAAVGVAISSALRRRR